MATRHNLCPNPGCKVDVSNWGGGSTPSRTTGLVGMSRTTGARYTSSSFISTPPAAANPGDVVTISVDILTESFDDPTVDIYFMVNGITQVGAVDHTTLNFGVVKRVSITRTVPVGATTALMLIDGINMVISPTSFTGVLHEVSGSAGTYFDGDSPGASWDGTDGLSASTFVDVIDLVVANADQSQMAQNMALSQVHALGIQSAHQAQSASNIGSLIPQSGFVSGAAVGNPILEGAVSVLVIGLAGKIE